MRLCFGSIAVICCQYCTRGGGFGIVCKRKEMARKDMSLLANLRGWSSSEGLSTDVVMRIEWKVKLIPCGAEISIAGQVRLQ